MTASHTALDTGGFVGVTEISGQDISVEQLERTCHRYHWALPHCRDADVVELACGAGQGLGLLARVARSVRGSDISPEVLAEARKTYGDTIPLEIYPADAIPLPAGSVDALLMFEAIYYLPDIDAFLAEAKRVMRPDGRLLIVTANKDLYDFTPSPYSVAYYGVIELHQILSKHGFSAKFAGYIDTARVSWRQRVFRPIKFLANRLGVMPRTMAAKSLFKRIVFGAMTKMPARIDSIALEYVPPEPLTPGVPDRRYKVLYCSARQRNGSEE